MYCQDVFVYEEHSSDIKFAPRFRIEDVKCLSDSRLIEARRFRVQMMPDCTFYSPVLKPGLVNKLINGARI